MKVVLLISFIFLSSLFSKTPNVINYVNPKSFSGLWYEIARTYNVFEHDCVAATVEYVLKDLNKYKVFNRCFDKVIGGDLIQYNGTAQGLEKNSVSKLNMTYFWIFTKEYKVIYLNDYKSAVVADNDMNNVWIMSRTPKMNKNEFNKIINFLKTYMDTNKFIITPQDEKGRYK